VSVAAGSVAYESPCECTLVPGADSTNACWHSCRAGHAQVVQALVEHGADLDWLGYEGLTCRAAGLQSANPELVEMLSAR
jgi:uncharacterized protein